MPVAATGEIVRRAMAEGYAVPAINVVNDLTLEAVLAAADELRCPLIVQTSVKTVRSIGRRRAQGDVGRHDGEHPRARGPPPRPLPRPRRHQRLPGGGLELGALRWPRAVRRGERAPVRRGRGRGASLRRRRRGRDRGHPRRRGRHRLRRRRGRSRRSRSPSASSERTGVDIFAPAIGNAHGLYRARPTLDHQRISDLVAASRASPWPSTAGRASSADQFRDLIARGCAKVNVSTALKIAYMEANREYLTARPGGGRPAEALRPRARGGHAR